MTEPTGRIHSFESFGGVDGKGIRYVVFTQGCGVGCVFCHNADTWNPAGGKQYTVSEVMAKIRGCKPYLTLSNGGVTVSGGEPLQQPAFVAELFRRCKAEDINTAIDTSAAGTPADIDAVSENLDLFIVSVKHVTDEGHRRLTFHGRDALWDNIRHIDAKGIPLWVRFVVIPGVTDDETTLTGLGEFVESLASVRRVELLPYHTLGAHKWTELGMYYSLEGVPPADEETMERAAAVMRRHFPNVVVVN
jgi:pyruvate formate lyase activating enzyme